MGLNPPPFSKFLFVCEKVRENGESSCGVEAIERRYVDRLKEEVQKRGLKGKIRVTRSGCLDVCKRGPNILVYPEGKWYCGVNEEELRKVIDQELA